MDPFVRLALATQRLLSLVAGVVLSVLLGAWLVWWATEPTPELLKWIALSVLFVSLGVRLARRLRQLSAEDTTRLDLELFTHAVVAAYLLVLHAPGNLEGPFYPLLYALIMLAAAFCRPAAALGTLAFAIVLEGALWAVAFEDPTGQGLVPHALLLGLFACLNLCVFRAELARVRRLSRARIDAEIQRMKEAARSYRLIGAPTGAAERRSLPPAGDEERLLRSGVDEIHQALEFALALVRRALGVRSAVLLGLDTSGQKLHIQELSSEVDGIEPGPFRASDGIFGAVLARGEPVTVCGPKAGAHVPYYAVRPAIGGVCAIPALDHGQLRGVLVVDRESREPFSQHEEELLGATTRYILRAIENERVFVQLERAKLEQGKLYRAAEALAAATTEAQVIEACVGSAREFASFDFAAVTLFDKASGEHEICAVSGEDPEHLVGQRFRHNSGLVSMVVANRHPLPYRGDYDPSRQVVFTRRLAPPGMPSLLVLPLLVHERALGTLVLGSKRRGSFGEAVRPTLEVLASHVAVSLSNARMLKRLEEMATTDGLTGLFNKRALVEIGQQKLRSAKRFSKPLSLLVCDIDHFKRVNDTHGHDIGDVVIRGFGDVLRRAKRDTDVVGRFGGEEFVVVCEETDGGGAALLAERIRAEIEAATFHTETGPLQVTCSVGVATFPAAGPTWEAMFRATDEALYASKRNGRNRITVWTPRLQGCAA
jgi:diguanylate cyclase (GGDEF)-like protein